MERRETRGERRDVVMVVMVVVVVMVILAGGCKSINKSDNGNSGSSNQAEVIDSLVVDSVLTVEDLTTMIRENPRNPALYAQRAALQALANRYEEAINDISLAIRLDSMNPVFFVSQAEYFMYGGQPNSAKKSLNDCLNIFKDNTEIMLKLAEIHFYLQEYTPARILLRDVNTIDDDIAQTYFLEGLILLENRDTTNAIRNLRYAIEKDPEFYAAYVSLGRVHGQQNDDLAIDYYRSALDIMPDSYEARYNLGLYLQDHNYPVEAENEYHYIINNVDSTVASPYYNIGYINLIYKEDFDQALQFFTLALEKEPEYVEAWYNRGFVYEVTGKLNKARSDYQESLKINANYPLSIKGLNRLDEGKPFQYK